MDIPFDIEAFKAEASEWAKQAKQCKCCQGWAKLNDSGKCLQCSTKAHTHPEIVINFEE